MPRLWGDSGGAGEALKCCGEAVVVEVAVVAAAAASAGYQDARQPIQSNDLVKHKGCASGLLSSK